jgi:hypothetical protein
MAWDSFSQRDGSEPAVMKYDGWAFQPLSGIPQSPSSETDAVASELATQLGEAVSERS